MGLYNISEPYPSGVKAFIDMYSPSIGIDKFSVKGADKGYQIEYIISEGERAVVYLGEATDHGRTYVYYNRDIDAPVYLGFSSSNLEFDCLAGCDELWAFSALRYMFSHFYNLQLDDHSIQFATELMLSQIREQDRQFCFIRSAFEYMKQRRFYPFSMFGEDPDEDKNKVKWLN